MRKFIFLIAILCFVSSPMISYAHPGRTDAYGCHTCRTNCASWGLSTGEYHCHNSKGVTQPVAPIKSTYGENGTGYTTPAPEYATPKTYMQVKSQTQTNAAPVVPVKTEAKKVSWFSKFLSWFK